MVGKRAPAGHPSREAAGRSPVSEPLLRSPHFLDRGWPASTMESAWHRFLALARCMVDRQGWPEVTGHFPWWPRGNGGADRRRGPSQGLPLGAHFLSSHGEPSAEAVRG